MRIRSLAERTRYQVFSCLGRSHHTDGDEGEESDEVDEPWMLEATRVYEQSLMLLAEQDAEPEMDAFSC